MTEQHRHVGSSLDDLLQETGELAEVNVAAIRRTIAWLIYRKMESENISKNKMAEMMETSRSSLDRLLDPENNSVTLQTLNSAARVVGKTLRIELS